VEYTRLRLVSGRDNHRDSSERDQARQSPRVYFMHRNKERDEDVAIAKVAGLPRTIDPLLIRCRKQASVFRVPDYLFKIHSRLDAHVFSSLLCRRRADVGRLGTFIRAFQTPDVAFTKQFIS
jgi:hypothetical protein